MQKLQIIIAQRGWVFIGFVDETENDVILNRCYNIRRWGTEAGLGEIALGGPTGNTILDDYNTMHFHPLAIVARIDCNEEKWKSLYEKKS